MPTPSTAPEENAKRENAKAQNPSTPSPLMNDAPAPQSGEHGVLNSNPQTD
ncbi:MAG: hypothetical protein AAFW83_10400 [Pseudomonadota bacterium]